MDAGGGQAGGESEAEYLGRNIVILLSLHLQSGHIKTSLPGEENVVGSVSGLVHPVSPHLGVSSGTQRQTEHQGRPTEPDRCLISDI